MKDLDQRNQDLSRRNQCLERELGAQTKALRLLEGQMQATGRAWGQERTSRDQKLRQAEGQAQEARDRCSRLVSALRWEQGRRMNQLFQEYGRETEKGTFAHLLANSPLLED